MKQQLEAAGIAYYAALTKAWLTMDEARLATLRTATCSCRLAEEAIRKARVDGFKVQIRYQILGANAHDVQGPVGSATLTFSTAGTVITDANGKEVGREAPVNRGIKEMQFRRQGARWLVHSIESLT